MLGKIIGVEDNLIEIDLDVKLEEMDNIINLYVVIEDDKKIVGEIVDIKDNHAFINLLGEFNEDKFVFGISKKPSFKSSVNLISI